MVQQLLISTIGSFREMAIRMALKAVKIKFDVQKGVLVVNRHGKKPVNVNFEDLEEYVNNA